MLDVGTGSGAVALAIADELPGCEVTATDTSPAALEVARANAERLGLADRVTLPRRHAAGGGGVRPDRRQPALRGRGEWASLEPEVTEWEPREALLAGPDGLDAIRALLAHVGDRERSSSRYAGATAFAACALEVGEGQADAVEVLLADAGFTGIERRRDLAGIERVVWGRDELRSSRSDRDGAPAVRSALERCLGEGGVAVFPADGLYGLAGDPLDPAPIDRIHRLKGRDDGKPSAVLYFSPLAMRELVGGLGPRARDAVGALLAGPGDPGPRQPRAPLPARLPRGPGPARRPPPRRPARRASCARSSRPRRTSAASRRRPGSRRCRRKIVAGADLAIDGGELTGLPSTVVDIASIDVDGTWSVLREGGLPTERVAEALG